ncbi:hypothetical protein DIZ81_02020 [Legionella taurinensis]|uniref:Uncharacterized protein n=1 Tax=Legionella taurinensis TaxID=70611 RepID=A0A3A5LDQ4_9GAMM|nr:hypothetical protein [Legionella taurinensis]MDX1836354.1 hypothetical protein [Legionella taurinensis]PUT41897.1 hypothetical protein DB744_02025 [Legionella taurinensis]PUT44686.1 hypothetical protein DB746_02025 [Legionella taurinensis]PUT48006.1 hypothetical protein DB743_00185 [Legionella taurinensis]PUT48819.1 hypothetical protein DB745_02025 [Legionella taurinensis]
MIEQTIPVQEVHEEHCTIHHHHFKRISWTAIFVGALIGVGLGFLLTLFSMAIGLSLFTLSSNGAIVLAIGGFLGVVIGLIASMLTAGYAAGYLGRLYCPKRNLGIVYGFTTWTVALLLSAVAIGHISQYVANYPTAIPHSVKQMIPVVTANTEAVKPSASAPEAQKQAAADNSMRIDTSPSNLAWNGFVIFVLFFIGALSTCFGACWGMTCKRFD